MKFKKTEEGYVQDDNGTLELKGKASPKWLRFLEKNQETNPTLTKDSIAQIKAEREERTRRLKESLK